MSKLDINTLLNNSLAKKVAGESVQESEGGLNIKLEDAGKSVASTSDCEGCGKNSELALNLEDVAVRERIESYIGEDTLANIRAALGAGLATFAVLEARHAS